MVVVVVGVVDVDVVEPEPAGTVSSGALLPRSIHPAAGKRRYYGMIRTLDMSDNEMVGKVDTRIWGKVGA